MSRDVDSFLAHYGVKGMQWGVRKGDDSDTSTNGYSVGSDGSISIDKGHTLQRVFDSKLKQVGTGETGANYFSFTEKDKHTYVSMLGAGAQSRFKLIRKLASDKISTTVAREPLKAPSTEDAFAVLKKTVDSYSGTKELSKNGISKFKGDYDERKAKAWYQEANASLVRNRESDLSKSFFKDLESSGFNMLLDETDAGKLAELPVIVINGKKSLSLISVKDIESQDLSAAKAFASRVENRSVRSIDELKSAN